MAIIKHVRGCKYHRGFISSRSTMFPVRIFHWIILMQQFLSGTRALLQSPADTALFERHLLKGILNISVTYFSNDKPLVILTEGARYNDALQNKLADSMFRDIHDVTSWPVLTINTNCREPVKGKTAVKYGSVIVLLIANDAGYEQVILKRLLITLAKCSSWNPRAQYVIVSTAAISSTQDQHAVAASVLKNFYIVNIFNVIFLIQEPVQRKNYELNFKTFAIDIFTFSPHGQNKNVNKHFDVIYLNRFVSEAGAYARFMNNAKLFRSDPVTDMRGRKMIFLYDAWPPLVMSSDTNGSATSLLYDEGLEVRLMKTVAENMNFTCDFRVTGELLKIDGYFGAQWLNTKTLDILDTTWTHYTGAFAWFVPRERPVPPWQSLIKIFKPSFWLLVYLSYILGSLIFWGLGNTQSYESETTSFRNIVPIFMNTLAIILSGSVCKKPKRTRSQIFFLLWSVYCMQVNNAYQSSLIGFLTNPGHLPHINDLDSLLESGIQLGIQNGLQQFFTNSSDPRNERVLKSSIDCNPQDIDKCAKRMAYEGDLAVAAGRIGLEFLAYTKYKQNGKSLYVPFKENIQQVYMVIYLKKGSILLEPINSIVLRLQSAGIIDKWVSDIRRRFGKHFDSATFENGVCVLTMKHLEGAFYLLLLGVLASVTIWFIEITHNLFGHRLGK